MKLIGLGGGIGSGKSTVSERLARRGAVVIDADLIAREVVQAGGAAYEELRKRFASCFGPAVDAPLDRAALAAIVFSDAEELAALNAITHPAISRVIRERLDELAASDAVVILDAALLFDVRVSMVGQMVVDVDPEIAVARLVEFRNFSEGDARRRIAAQMRRQDRLALADYVIDNSGSPADLDCEVEAVWNWIASLGDSARSA